MRQFTTGATRDSDEEKYDFEGFLSPFVLNRFAIYMHKHRKQADGKLRASDNWQKGIPRDVYMKSLFRHFIELWTLHRDKFYDDKPLAKEEALCAMLFNTQGYLHSLLMNDEKISQPENPAVQDDINKRLSGLCTEGIDECSWEETPGGYIQPIPCRISGVPLRGERISPQDSQTYRLPDSESVCDGVSSEAEISSCSRNSCR